MMKFVICLAGFLLLQFSTLAQVTNTATLDTSGGEQIGNTAIGAYLDLYYGYNFNEPASKSVPYFVSQNRHNELNVNLAFLDIRYQSEKLRARVVPGFGTYMNSNYIQESGSLRYLVEANAGLRLHGKKNIWLDAGILGSPYTNESAISKDHLMYTRSLAPEYVPYYLCGLKFTFPVNKKLNFYLYIMNGWQQIRDKNNGKSIGTQLEFRPNANNLINWNTYLGDERLALNPAFDDYNAMRYFSDIYWLYNAGKKWSFTSCAYAGVQERRDFAGNQSFPFWWQGNFIASYAFNSKISLAGRMEYFSDSDRVMIADFSSNGFEGGSAGICLNYKVAEKSLIRLDSRYFLAPNTEFDSANGGLETSLFWLCANATVWF